MNHAHFATSGYAHWCAALLTWLLHMWDMTTWLIYTWGMTHSYVRHDSCTPFQHPDTPTSIAQCGESNAHRVCATPLIHTCDMTHSYVKHNLCTLSNIQTRTRTRTHTHTHAHTHTPCIAKWGKSAAPRMNASGLMYAWGASHSYVRHDSCTPVHIHTRTPALHREARVLLHIHQMIYIFIDIHRMYLYVYIYNFNLFMYMHIFIYIYIYTSQMCKYIYMNM